MSTSTVERKESHAQIVFSNLEINAPHQRHQTTGKGKVVAGRKAERQSLKIAKAIGKREYTIFRLKNELLNLDCL